VRKRENERYKEYIYELKATTSGGDESVKLNIQLANSYNKDAMRHGALALFSN